MRGGAAECEAGGRFGEAVVRKRLLAFRERRNGVGDGVACGGLLGCCVARVGLFVAGCGLDERGERGLIAADAGLPLCFQGRAIDVFFGAAAFERCVHLLIGGCGGASESLFFEAGFDLGGSGGKAVQCLLGDAGDFEGAFFAGDDLVAETGNFGSEVGAVELAVRFDLFEHWPAFDAAPLSIGGLGGVQHDGMGVELGLLVSVQVVPEEGGGEVVGLDELDLSVLPDAGVNLVLLDMRHGCLDGAVMCGDEAGVAADQGE